MGLIQTILQKVHDSGLEQEVLDMYAQHGGRQKVADMLGCAYGSVGHIVKALGGAISRHDRRSIQKYLGVIRDPFDGSDFGDYLLGYIIGDGSIRVRNGVVRGVCISSSDLEHLTTIRDMWDSQLQISGPCKGNYSIECYDADIAEKLVSLGVAPVKSKVGMTLQVQVTPAMYRGLFDSDGSVTATNGGNSRRMFVAGGAEYVKQFVEAAGVPASFQNRKSFVCAYYYSRAAVEAVRDYMYKDATIYMKRKHDRLYF